MLTHQLLAVGCCLVFQFIGLNYLILIKFQYSFCWIRLSFAHSYWTSSLFRIRICCWSWPLTHCISSSRIRFNWLDFLLRYPIWGIIPVWTWDWLPVFQVIGLKVQFCFKTMLLFDSRLCTQLICPWVLCSTVKGH